MLVAHAGCGTCYALDGNWKLCFAHCQFPTVSTIPGIPQLNFPNVCPEEPEGKFAFCTSHMKVAAERGYCTDVRGFHAQIDSCQLDDDSVRPERGSSDLGH